MISETGSHKETNLPCRRRQGFSLIEILLAIAIMALASGFLIGNLIAIADRGGELSPEEALFAAVRTARFESAAGKEPVSLSFDNETGKLVTSKGSEFSLEKDFLEESRRPIRFFLQPSQRGLSSTGFTESRPIEVSSVTFAPDRSGSRFIVNLDYGAGSVDRLFFDPFSNLTYRRE